MKKTFLGLLIVLACACAPTEKRLSGRFYAPRCPLNGVPSALLCLHPGGSFSYRLAFVDTYTGRWHLSGDTLVMGLGRPPSNWHDSLWAKAKRSTRDTINEYYLIKGRRLYELDDTVSNPYCHLRLYKKGANYCDTLPWRK
jgi:hypothetical protein